MRNIDVKTAYEMLIKDTGAGYLTGPDIKKLFKVTSDSTVQKIKKPVQEIMREKNIGSYNGRVTIRELFEYYGITEKELEHKYQKLLKYNIEVKS